MITGVPVNVIAGPLGVGKTTVVNQLLAQRPAGQRWAVLINEYGLIGLDAALIEGERATADVAVKEVAGGCICCSAGPVFEVSLVQLLRRRPDRVLIEPTGLATLSGILDTLHREGIRDAVDVRSIICLLNPETLARDLERDEVRDQAAAADVLLASKADLASAAHLDAFATWAGELFPPKQHVGRVQQGDVDAALLDRVRDRGEAPHATHHHHAHPHTIDQGVDRAGASSAAPASAQTPIVRQHHRSAATTTLGWVCLSTFVFDAGAITQWIDSLARLAGLRRLKAVLHTSGGWQSFNWTSDGDRDVRPSAYRRDSRVELIIESDTPPDADALEATLRACLR